MILPSDFTTASERAIFNDILNALSAAYQEADSDVTFTTFINARFVVELWYMRVGIARDKAYTQTVNALLLAA